MKQAHNSGFCTLRLEQMRLWLAIFLLLTLSVIPLSARTLPSEFVRFQFVCVNVALETGELRSNQGNAPETDYSMPDLTARAAVLVTKKFDERSLRFPIESGRRCVGKTGPNARNLILKCYVTKNSKVAKERSQIIGALILHAYFDEERGSEHQYPTELFVCSRQSFLERTSEKIDSYIDRNLMPLVETGKKTQRKGLKALGQTIVFSFLDALPQYTAHLEVANRPRSAHAS